MENLHQLLPVVLQRRQKLLYRWNSSSYYLGEYEGFLKKYNRWSRGKPEWNAVSDGVFYENVTGLTLTRPQCMTSWLFGGQKTEKLCSDWLKSCVIPSRYWEAVFVWPDYWNFSCGNASTGNSFSINAAVCFHFESDLPSTDKRSSRRLWVWQIINGSKPPSALFFV